MAPIRLACGGIKLDDWHLPSFELREGAAVTIVIPREFIPLAEDLAERLTGKFGVDPCSVVRVRPAEAPQGFLRLLRGSTASRWLQRAGGITAESAKDILGRLDIRPDNLRSLPATPRLQVALEVAWARGAGVIVFDIRGLDSLGHQSVFEMVGRKLSKCPAIYLSFPYHTQGEMRQDVFPNSVVVEITRQSAVAV
jgi:hypothetical protein